MFKKEQACSWCGKSYFPRYSWSLPYCSKDCRDRSCREKEESEKEHSDWEQRLHDGMRLLSDDFGELPGDETVTFQ